MTLATAEDHGDAAPLTLQVSLPADTDPALIPALQQAVETAMALVARSSGSLLRDADQLAELVTGLARPDPGLLEERLARAQTLRTLIETGEWLTAEQLNALQPDPPANRSHPASDWKRRGRIFGVHYAGREYFARYQFDALYQPLPIVKEILKRFGTVADPWKIAAWFHFPNGWITAPAVQPGEPEVAIAPRDALDRRDALLAALARRHDSYVA